MGSKIVFGQYYDTGSWLHKLDPRTKLIATILLMVAIFLIDSIYVLLGCLFATIILIFTTRIPFGKFLRSIKMISFLLLFTFIFQIIFRKDPDNAPLATYNFTLTLWNMLGIIVVLILYFLSAKIIRKFRLTLFIVLLLLAFLAQMYLTSGLLIVNYNIEIYEIALESSLFLIIRLITLIMISSLLTLSTKPTDLNLGLEKLLKPLNIFSKNLSSILSMIISIALRFIPTLIKETNKILKAQASRGVDFNEGNIKTKIGQIVSLIVPMFIISYKKAYDLSDAMDARGYNPDKKRTSINVIKFKWNDYFVLTLTFLMLAGLIVGKIFNIV